MKQETAWVTKAGSRTVRNEALRTSSAGNVYTYLKHTVKSYRDLPVKINQWGNAVRWEHQETLPFVRSKYSLGGINV